MTELSRSILDRYQVRKTKKQKQEFIEYLCRQIPELRVEESKRFSNRNLIIGDIQSAKILLGAHYDTCANMIVPNFITPLNPLLAIMYSLIIMLPLFLILIILNTALYHTVHSFWIQYFTTIFLIGVYLYLMIAGPANKHTANDNTSGVITLLEIYAAMPPESREKVAFIFFDNEEKGLIGSSVIRKEYKDQLKEKLLINFDCVSDGDYFLLAVSKKAQKAYSDTLSKIFVPSVEKQPMLKKAEKVYYPSDQAGFPNSVAVAAMKHKKVIGYYLDKIHTKHDTHMDEENITYLRNHTLELIKTVAGDIQ